MAKRQRSDTNDDELVQLTSPQRLALLQHLFREARSAPLDLASAQRALRHVTAAELGEVSLVRLASRGPALTPREDALTPLLDVCSWRTILVLAQLTTEWRDAVDRHRCAVRSFEARGVPHDRTPVLTALSVARHLPALSELCISSPECGEQDLGALVRCWPRLRHVDLRGCTALGDAALVEEPAEDVHLVAVAIGCGLHLLGDAQTVLPPGEID